MPTYVYECKKCSHRFEIMQGISDPPRRRCPECRGAVRRVLMPGGGLIFKGTGFYITDYRNKENKERAERESKRKAKAERAAGGEATTKAEPTKKAKESKKPKKSSSGGGND